MSDDNVVVRDRRPTIHGDQHRAVTVVLPPTYEALHSIVLSSFVMNRPVRYVVLKTKINPLTMLKSVYILFIDLLCSIHQVIHRLRHYHRRTTTLSSHKDKRNTYSYRFYRNGKELITAENYDNIQGGDQIVVVDSQGRKVDLKDLFQTTYDREFAQKPLPRRSQGPEPEKFEPMKDDRDFLSVTQREYRPWKVERDVVPQQEPELPKSLPFTATTTNMDEFRPYKIEPRRVQAPEDYKRETIPFNATTTNQDTFKKWPIDKRAEPSEPVPPPPTIPFNARTTNMDEFRPYKIEPRQVQASEDYNRETIPFNATTTNQDTFKKWPIEKRTQVSEPVPPPPTIPFNARTTNMDEFKAYPIQARRMEEAAPSIPESLPFKGISTTADTYRRWSIPKKTYISLVPANDAFISRQTGEVVGDYLDVVGQDEEESVGSNKE